jgi:glutaconate CoA-transferase subunit A
VPSGLVDRSDPLVIEQAVTGKVLALAEAVKRLLRDGDTVFVGGFGQGVPFAIAHEVIRQRRRNLTLCRTGADIAFDLLVAAGCVSKVIFGWYGNPGIGLSHVLRRAVAEKTLTIEESSNFGILLRLHAAALGVPFLPTRTLRAGDVGTASDRVADITCPFTGEHLSAVPALQPDVAILHAQEADTDGNVRMWGIIGDTLEGAKASKRVLCSVERIVPSAAIAAQPNLTVLPAHMVAAVCVAPWGAHPSYVQDLYDRDDGFYRDFDRLSRDAQKLSAYLDREIYGVSDHAGYLSQLPDGRTARLAVSRRAGA